MTRSLSVLAVVGASLLLAATASPQTGTTLTITHQLRGCHSWSVNGGAYKPSQALTLTKGATLTIVDDSHIREDWTYFEAGKPQGTTTFELTRKT